MATRSRARGTGERRRNERTPGVLRDGLAPDASAVQHGERGITINWRLFSGLIVASLSLVVALFFVSDAFYVRSISVAGLRYLQPEEIFRWANIADAHIFRVDEAQVRANILQSSAVADAEVVVGWPPDMIRIVVTEREPALIWEQADVAVWVDVGGRVLMLPSEERPDLLRVVVENGDGPVSPNTVLPADVVDGALQLRELIPQENRDQLTYHPINGLGFTDAAGGWRAWFGSGLDMPVKIVVYKALVANLQQRGIQPSEINIINPDAPHWCDRIGGCLPN